MSVRKKFNYGTRSCDRQAGRVALAGRQGRAALAVRQSKGAISAGRDREGIK